MRTNGLHTLTLGLLTLYMDVAYRAKREEDARLKHVAFYEMKLLEMELADGERSNAAEPGL